MCSCATHKKSVYQSYNNNNAVIVAQDSTKKKSFLLNNNKIDNHSTTITIENINEVVKDSNILIIRNIERKITATNNATLISDIAIRVDSSSINNDKIHVHSKEVDLEKTNNDNTGNIVIWVVIALLFLGVIYLIIRQINI